MNVESWLRVLGLERYAEAFAENGVDPTFLPELTAVLTPRGEPLAAPPLGGATETQVERDRGIGVDRAFRTEYLKMAVLQTYIGGGRQARI